MKIIVEPIKSKEVSGYRIRYYLTKIKIGESGKLIYGIKVEIDDDSGYFDEETVLGLNENKDEVIKIIDILYNGSVTPSTLIYVLDDLE